MPDVYATITDADVDAAGAARGRAGAARRRPAAARRCSRSTPRRSTCPDGAEVLEVGCGTGAISRFLDGAAAASRTSPASTRRRYFVERARELAGDLPADVRDRRRARRWSSRTRASTRSSSTRRCATCRSASARSPRPTACCGPAARLAVFDGDYATMTFALDGRRPAAELRRGGARHARARPVADAADRAAARARPASPAAGCAGHAYTSTGGTDYFLALVDRGADALAARGTVGAPARRRAEGGGPRPHGGRDVLRPHRLRERGRARRG